MNRRSPQSEQGAVAMLVSVFAIAMFLLAALVVDLGLARDERRQAQNAADAAALAGANVLYPVSGTCTATNPTGTNKPPCTKDAETEAQVYAQKNYGVLPAEWTAGGNGCALPSGFAKLTTPCISFDDLVEPTKVRVDIPMQQIKTGLGVLADVDHVNITAGARATVLDGGEGACTLCFLGDIDTQNSDFTVEDGSIHVDGSVNASSHNSNWTAENIYLVGEKGSKVTMTPSPTPANLIGDPLKDDPRFPPSVSGLGPKSDPCKDGPGIYSGNNDLKNNETCTLEPGLYVVDGTWSMKNKSIYRGAGVTLYVRFGELDFKNGHPELRAPTAAEAATTGGIADFAIVYDRANAKTLALQGNGSTNIDGGVYVAAALLDFNGTSDFVFSRGPVIAKGIVGKGGGNKSTVLVKDAQDLTIKNLPGPIALDQ